MTHSISNVWDIDAGLAADFDGSLSGLGSQLGSTTYNMSEALLALPVFKQEILDNSFQYVLGAATSPAVKLNEETLTYLNQGQSYELKLKKLGEMSDVGAKYLKSVIRVTFHERRMQYMEKEQMEFWCQARPRERLLDIDIPLSYGLAEVHLDPTKRNSAEFIWDPLKDTGIYFRVNCISTEFTVKKHGGEKGVPFRIQVETYLSASEQEPIHCASCQIKVFKPKGADRKHKTDRDKMDKRPEPEKERYQPSYECTVLAETNHLEDIPVKTLSESQLPSTPVHFSIDTSSTTSPAYSVLSNSFTEARSPNNSSSPLGSTSPTPTASVAVEPTTAECFTGYKELDKRRFSDSDPINQPLLAETNAADVVHWLQFHRFSNYVQVFEHFSGADLLRLTRDDLIQICGLADGIRLNNAMQSKAVRPKLTVYMCQVDDTAYHAVYLNYLTRAELLLKLSQLFKVEPTSISEMYCQGPSGIHFLVTDEVVGNMRDLGRFTVEATTKDESQSHYSLLLKLME